MGEEKKEEKAISRRKYLGAVGGLAAAAAVGWGLAGYLASKPKAPAVEKTVTITKTEAVTPTAPATTPIKKYAGLTLKVPFPEGWGSWAPGIAMVHEFEEETGMKVDYHFLPWAENGSKQLLEITNKTGAYDLNTVGAEEWPMFLPHLIGLNSRIEEHWGSLNAFMSDVFPKLQEPLIYEGEHRGIPIHANTMFLAYRKDLFEDPKNQKRFEEQYGRELQPPKTFQELDEVATFFNDPPRLYGITAEQHKWILFSTLITLFYDAGFELLDKDLRPTMKYDDKARETMIEILKWHQDAYQKKKYINIDSLKFLDGEILDFFTSGNAAMALYIWMDFWGGVPGYHAPEVRKRIGKVEAIPLPTIKPDGVHHGGVGSWWIHGIPEDSKHPDAAWEYIKWAISEKVQLACAAGQFPPYKSICEKAIKLTMPHAPDVPLIPKDVFEVFTKAKNLYYCYSANKMVIEVSMEPLTKAQDLFESCLLGMITPEKAIDEYTKTLEETLKAAGYYRR